MEYKVGRERDLGCFNLLSPEGKTSLVSWLVCFSSFGVKPQCMSLLFIIYTIEVLHYKADSSLTTNSSNCHNKKPFKHCSKKGDSGMNV